MNRRKFGQLADGRDVGVTRLETDGIVVDILDYGATIADIRVKTARGEQSVVLGFGDIAGYEAQPYYMGCIAGRCANRIRDGHVEIDGRTFALSTNNNGRNHLHGGFSGFNRKLWVFQSADATSVTLTHRSPDGDEGYPGTVDVTCRYSVEGGALTIDLSATTDAPTLVNLAGHSYFNLDGSDEILDHRLMLVADAYTPVDDLLIPTGEIRPVEASAYDFRQSRRIGDGLAEVSSGYDTNFASFMAPSTAPRSILKLEGSNGIALEMLTTEPGVQFYSGGFLKPGLTLRDGRPVRRFGGLCLEPQRFPDANHHPAFPGSRLDPGETYRQQTIYRFSS